ncbi:NAD(P)H-hydrate dehydratase [Paracoccus stylophorae]|uniref:Bifunctional NAD(P)H-hydrate repair enzyme n=2 Tax=Paracoccus stylophorae TaxID=659350 RepID=A0ABY7T1B6_9RHOB|nr:NAD(P)H-hydrate dehydratase [Paracoccus stylophorae]WCR12488.1 NAD(P)H-hydrate dehydratase [Paracoccus stylophorae]
MRAIEAAAIDSGTVSGLDLMERAGAAVAGQIRLRWPRAGTATVLCGPGNNGGDGFVIAGHLARAGWRVRVLGMDSTPGADAAEMKRRWREIGPILPLSLSDLHRARDSDVFVDAIFGTGLTRPVQGEIDALLRHMGGSDGDGAFYRSRLVAVDCPSGLCMDSGAFLGRPRGPHPDDLRVALTVAFDSPKPGHLLERGPDCCGRLVIADIGLHPWRTGIGTKDGRRPADLSAIWPEFDIEDGRRPPDATRDRNAWLTKRHSVEGHKFHHGHALILAGGLGQGGAARLAARAALRIGAGLVTICPPKSALIEHLGPPDALMRRPVEDANALADLLQDRRIGAVGLGPGCGVDRAGDLLPAVLDSGRPCVLDADALTALAARGFKGLHGNCVLTPHAGEFARLFPDLARQLETVPQSGPAWSRLDAVRAAAARSGATVLLKGADTVIARPPRDEPDAQGQAVIHSATDIPWLATAGAGDVLTGIIAGLLARGLPPCDAASIGVLMHARAARRFGPGLTADDLPQSLAAVLRDLPRRDSPRTRPAALLEARPLRVWRNW